MQLLQKRGVAILLCVMMILSACLLGIMFSLARLRAQSEELFSLGPEGDGRGIQYDLREMAAQCANIASLGSQHLGEADTGVAGVRAAREALLAALEAGNARQKSRAADELLNATALLRTRLEGLAMDADSERRLGECAAGIVNAQRLIDKNMGAYNAGATYYNRALGSFPTAFLAPLVGAQPLELYE